MLGLYVTVPIACFRKGMAREYLETERLPPPSTCYGFLLSLVGETDRRRHLGVKATAAMLLDADGREPPVSTVLRTVWRVKSRPLGSGGNTRPDYQQLLTNVELVIWLDSSDEVGEGVQLEDRVRAMLDPNRRREIERFGGLSFGESTHLVDIVRPLGDADASRISRIFLVNETGRMTLPVWVDHVGSAGTRHAVGDLVEQAVFPPPDVARLPRIAAPENTAV